MYQKILDEALLELKETDFKDLYPSDTPVSYVRDCVIETDLEILIPDYYITNITERLNLYKELDSIETEENLMKFMERMIDRFGPIPKQTVTLLHTIRLRWLARSIGFEKLVLRNQRLTAYFINNPESGYFQSDQFTRILECMKENPSGYKMTEEKNRLFMTFRDVTGISEAIARLEPFQISKVTNI
jgi:transcription-repair coupling factor (superfamily II helicase)